MPRKYPFISDKLPKFMHGGDYNPDQWTPDIWERDMELMKLSKCNAMSVGIFSWVHLEPEEGKFTFDWVDKIMDMLAENNSVAVLATPSAQQPAWMSAKYPEIMRVDANGVRRHHGSRVKWCLTSEVYREKCAIINRKLAERYKDHEALAVWHISNEYCGACYCDKCVAAFREWLKEKYGTLDNLNHAWWNGFWGHTYTDWSQVDPPYENGEACVHGMKLDYKRFTTAQTVSFMENETAPLREITPDIPVTANLMSTYEGLDYWKFADAMDISSWDAYPMLHNRPDDWRNVGCDFSFRHDLMRSIKGDKPFMLMESAPSATNWMPVMKLKRPGIHKLSSLQAVAHGSDTVQYFQWRKSRGGSEKFHGAVVDHCGHENNRVFREVAEVGDILEKIQPVLGASFPAEVGLVFDWENRWAIEMQQGPRKEGRNYEETCVAHYASFWKRGIPVQIVNEDSDFSGLKLLVAPMLYMLRPGVAEKIEKFVKDGGVFVTTYWSGICDENDLCFQGGFPGPLRKLLGIWSEEMDVLYDDESNTVSFAADNSIGLQGEYRAHTFCDLVHAEGAEVLAEYTDDFYAGRPALTLNRVGEGGAYYVAFRSGEDFLDYFYNDLAIDLGLKRALDADIPEGVTAQVRSNGEKDFLFLLNFKNVTQSVDLGSDKYRDLIDGVELSGVVELPPHGSMVLEK